MPIPVDTRQAGDPGHLSDHHDISDELTSLQAQITATNTTVAALQAQLSAALTALPYIVPAATGVAATDTATLTAAFGSGRSLLFPSSHQVYVINGEVVIVLNGQVIITAGHDFSHGTVIQATTAGSRLRVSATDVVLYGGFAIDGANVATNGVVLQGSSLSDLHHLSVKNTVERPIKYANTGNNNFTTLYMPHAVGSGTSHGIGADEQANNNGQLLIAPITNNNAKSGVNEKGVGWTALGGGHQANGEYGVQHGEATDGSTTTGMVNLNPWLEANTLGGVRGSGKSARNLLVRFSDLQGLSNAAGSEDGELVIENSSGPRLSYGTDVVNWKLWVLPTASKAVFQPGGSATDIHARINGAGTGQAWLGETSDAMVGHSGGKIGYFGHAVAAQITVVGSRGGNAALQSLLSNDAGKGEIVDGTTA